MERTYKVSFIGYATIHVIAILCMLLIAGSSGHSYRLSTTDYLIFAHPVLTVLLMISLKAANRQNEKTQTIIKTALGILLLISFCLALYMLTSFYQENLDVVFLIFSNLFIIAFCASIMILLYGLIKKKI